MGAYAADSAAVVDGMIDVVSAVYITHHIVYSTLD
jgi:hypothetical protein